MSNKKSLILVLMVIAGIIITIIVYASQKTKKDRLLINSNSAVIADQSESDPIIPAPVPSPKPSKPPVRTHKPPIKPQFNNEPKKPETLPLPASKEKPEKKFIKLPNSKD